VKGPSLSLDDAVGVTGICFDAIEVDTSDGVLNVEVVLKGKRDDLRVASDEEIVWHKLGVNGPKADTLAL